MQVKGKQTIIPRMEPNTTKAIVALLPIHGKEEAKQFRDVLGCLQGACRCLIETEGRYGDHEKLRAVMAVTSDLARLGAAIFDKHMEGVA